MKAWLRVTEMFEYFPGICPVQLNKVFKHMLKLKALSLSLISSHGVYFYNHACAHFLSFSSSPFLFLTGVLFQIKLQCTHPPCKFVPEAHQTHLNWFHRVKFD